MIDFTWELARGCNSSIFENACLCTVSRSLPHAENCCARNKTAISVGCIHEGDLDRDRDPEEDLDLDLEIDLEGDLELDDDLDRRLLLSSLWRRLL